MCDYSLCGVPNRLAVEGEELVVHKFRTGSMGLASPAEFSPAAIPVPPAPRKNLWERILSAFGEASDSPAVTAVCVPPGAQLILKNVPQDLQRHWNIEEEESVFFVQLSADENSYRDALGFRNGNNVLLQRLREGMRLQVLSLGDASAGDERVFAFPVVSRRL